MTRNLFQAALAAVLCITTATAAWAADNPKTIRVTYVSAPFNVPSIVVKERKLLEQAMRQQGIGLEQPEITSGGQQIQALAAGAVDISSVLGSTSAILGRANGAEITVIAAYSRSPLAFHVMAMPQGPRTIEDLKGRKVAGPKGTTLNQLLVAALVSKGLTLADVSYINMDLPAARAALLAGSVDAATLAGNHSLAVEAAKGHVIASGAGLIEPTAVIAVRSAFLRDHPKLIEAYLAVHRAALDYMAKEPEAALAMAAAEQKISLDDARKMLAWYDFAPTMTDRDVANLEGDMAFMLENKLLTQRIDIRRDLIHKMAFAQ